MSLRGLNSVAIDVPNVDETALYYRDLRRASRTDGTVAFRADTGGEQLKLVHAHRRGLVELRIGANERDDLNRIACQLRRMNVSVSTPTTLEVRHPGADVGVIVELRPRIWERRDELRSLGVFLRCSTDHHNLLLQNAPSNFLHHTSWQVDDVAAHIAGAHSK